MAISLMVISALSSLAAFHFYRLSLHELPTPTGSLGDLDGSNGNIISLEDSPLDIEAMIEQILDTANSTIHTSR